MWFSPGKREDGKEKKEILEIFKLVKRRLSRVLSTYLFLLKREREKKLINGFIDLHTLYWSHERDRKKERDATNEAEPRKIRRLPSLMWWKVRESYNHSANEFEMEKRRKDDVLDAVIFFIELDLSDAQFISSTEKKRKERRTSSKRNERRTVHSPGSLTTVQLDG